MLLTLARRLAPQLEPPPVVLPELLGRLFRGAHGQRRRAAADILARTGLEAAKQALGRAAAKEKDPRLREHYTNAKQRADRS